MGSEFQRVWLGRLRSLRAWLLVALLSAFTGTGCSDDSEDVTTPAEYCRRTAEELCNNVAACCSLGAAECVSLLQANCDESTNNAIERGMVFDEAAAARCVESTTGTYAGCVVPVSDGTERTGPCATVLTGSRPPGGSCTFDGACQGAAGLSGVCLNDACVQVPTLAPGAPCGARENGVCAPDRHCDTTCQPLRPLGQSCTSSLKCASRNCANQVCSAFALAELCESLRETK